MEIPVSAGESPVALAESESGRSPAIPSISRRSALSDLCTPGATREALLEESTPVSALRFWLFAVGFLGWEPQPWWGRLGANCYREAPRIVASSQAVSLGPD